MSTDKNVCATDHVLVNVWSGPEDRRAVTGAEESPNSDGQQAG